MPSSLPDYGPSSKYLVASGPTVVPSDWIKEKGTGILHIGTKE